MADRQRAAAPGQSMNLDSLRYLDADGTARRFPLDPSHHRLVVGRSPACDLVIKWDELVSRVHAELEPIGEAWLVSDDGMSRNGTWLNGGRLTGRRRLGNGDRLRVGQTVLEFRPAGPASTSCTLAAPSDPVRITEVQRRVLQALVRPMRESRRPTMPATNKQIADELQMAVATVVDHLKKLCRKLGIADLPQGQRRFALANRAVELDLV